MADPTRRQIAMMADGPAVPEGREPASVVGKPSDEELLELMPETMHDEFAHAASVCSDMTGGRVKPGIFRVCLNTATLEYARAVLARWGHQPAPPAEGEVGELVAWLRSTRTARLTRAAELLEQRHPEPVPVAEGLPGPEDCDELGRCWLFSKVEKEWRLIDAGNPGVPHLKYCFSHWLPAHALPLPQGEVV